MPSEWIWAREKKSPAQPRYFRKIIEIEQPVKKAVIQAIAGTYMKIYVNQEMIGEIKSRLSLSILPIIKRVKVFDVTQLLKKGQNVIVVEAYTYEGFKGAFNLYGQIQLKNKKIQEIVSDTSWLCYKEEIIEEKGSWIALNYEDQSWKTVKSYGRPPNLNGDIFTPNLIQGEISLTQDYFGVQGYFYNLLNTFTGKLLTKLASPLIGPIIKLLKPFG